MQYKKILTIALAVFVVAGIASVASANHSWNGYHWGRTANPFTLELGDNVSGGWDASLATTASDWSLSDVLDTVVKPGATRARNCKATNGRVEVCSDGYGNTGWLGVAQIWISGDHITKGTVKVNDTYFALDEYNTPEWRNLVMCQEVGHTLGLDHQDEIFDNPNLGTCMDYTNDPSTNQHPNAHDYDELDIIYAHLDSVDTVLSSGGGSGGGGTGGGHGHGHGNNPVGVVQDIDLDNPSAWGEVVRRDGAGNPSVYVRHFGSDEVVTFVTWAK